MSLQGLPQEILREILEYFEIYDRYILSWVSIEINTVLREIYKNDFVLIDHERHSGIIRPKIGHVLLESGPRTIIYPIDSMRPDFIYVNSRECIKKEHEKYNENYETGIDGLYCLSDKHKKKGCLIFGGHYPYLLTVNSQMIWIKSIWCTNESIDHKDIKNMYYYPEDNCLNIITLDDEYVVYINVFRKEI